MQICRKASSPRYERDRITSYLLVSEITTGAKYITTSLVEMQPNGKQRIHSHATEQCYFILEGSGQMTVGDETTEVHTGDTIFIPSNSPHGLINTGKLVLRYLSAGSPVFGREKEKEFWPLQGNAGKSQ